MQKLLLSTAILVSSLAGTGARAQSPLPSPYATPNVGVFLAVCKQDTGGCYDEVGNVLMDKMDYAGISDICIEDPDYPKAVVPWLTTHTEDAGMPTEDGIFLALKSLYACKNEK